MGKLFVTVHTAEHLLQSRLLPLLFLPLLLLNLPQLPFSLLSPLRPRPVVFLLMELETLLREVFITGFTEFTFPNLDRSFLRPVRHRVGVFSIRVRGTKSKILNYIYTYIYMVSQKKTVQFLFNFYDQGVIRNLYIKLVRMDSPCEFTPISVPMTV